MPTIINPATGEVVREYPELDADGLRAALRAASRAAGPWREAGFAARAEVLRGAARLLDERVDALAEQMAIEMGKPLAAGRSEVGKCAWVCRYYADHGAAFLADEAVATDAGESFISYQPLGAVFAVMPWNFPLWQVFRFAAPALMAGNVGLLKHAENVPESALAIAALWRDAGAPDGVFQTLLIDHVASRRVIRSPLVQAVTLTGSTAAGRAVGRLAGERLKPVVLELGGSDPYLVLADADLDLAVETCVTSRLINAGQSCIAAKRFIVVDAVRTAFEERFVARMRQARVGDPLDPATEVGPLARVDLRDTLHAQVTGSVARGARCLLGGAIPPGRGAFYPPTVLTDVRRGMPAYREELFGPVAAIIPVRGEAAAIRVANDSVFGLGAAVFTRDLARGRRIARDQLQAGSCFVNALVKSDPRLPFGGIKESGHGRELGRAGIRAFVNVKTVSVS
jgi:succinate-semialdehyde dehydrogenase/glutarate-semialdehyde dehydrogenase